MNPMTLPQRTALCRSASGPKPFNPKTPAYIRPTYLCRQDRGRTRSTAWDQLEDAGHISNGLRLNALLAQGARPRVCGGLEQLLQAGAAQAVATRQAVGEAR